MEKRREVDVPDETQATVEQWAEEDEVAPTDVVGRAVERLLSAPGDDSE